MAQGRPQHERRVQAEAKRVRAQCSDYMNAVTLISSIEGWLEYEWGSDGHSPGHLESFDRFPDLEGLKPDFVAHFRTPYVLCGECMKTFRTGHKARRDVAQIVAYSQWRPRPRANGPAPSHDVLLLVSPESDDAAADAMESAGDDPDPSRKPGAPVVVVSVRLDPTTVNGEWFIMKWRKAPGNQPFTSPNVLPEACPEDLNGLITQRQHYSIRVDRPALSLAGRNPFINDTPPPLYTFIRAIYPALNQIMDEEDRDQFLATGRTVKRVTRQALLGAQILQTMGPPERYIQDALDWLVENEIATRVPDLQPPTYEIALDAKQIKDLEEYSSVKAARGIVRSRRAVRGGRQRKRGENPRQMSLF